MLYFHNLIYELTQILNNKSSAKPSAKVNLHFDYKVPPFGSATSSLSTAESRFSPSGIVKIRSLSWTTHRSITRRRTKLRTQLRRSTNRPDLFLGLTNYCSPTLIILKLSMPRNNSELMATKEAAKSRLDEINRLYCVIPVPNWYQIQQVVVTINTKINA